MMALSLSQNGPVLNLQSGQHGATRGALRQDDIQGLAATPVDPGAAYDLLYIFPIGNSLARGESLYDATRRAWQVTERWRKPVLCVGIDGGLSKAIFAAKAWHEVGNDGKHEFVGEEIEGHELTGQRWTQVINTARGYWQRGNWLAVEFDGNHWFKIHRGSADKEWQEL